MRYVREIPVVVDEVKESEGTACRAPTEEEVSETEGIETEGTACRATTEEDVTNDSGIESAKPKKRERNS